MRKSSLTSREIVAIVFVLGILLVIFFPCPPWSRKTIIAQRAACVNNLKQVGLILALYASENKNQFPPIDHTKNNFMFDANLLYPEYLTYPEILACPADPYCDYEHNFRLRSTRHHPKYSIGDVHADCVTDMSYCYLGWEVTSDAEAESLFEKYDRLALQEYDQGIRNADNGSILFPVLYKKATLCFFPPPGLSKSLNATEVEALRQRWIQETGHIKRSNEIPVMWDRPYTDPSNFSHIPPSGNVLYLDGHVEFVKFGEKFPMTEKMARLLAERPRAPIPDCDGYKE